MTSPLNTVSGVIFSPPTCTFFTRRVRLDSEVLKKIGIAFTAAATYGLFQWRSTPKPLFIAHLVIGVLGIGALHGCYETAKKEQCLALIDQKISEGKYSVALQIARICLAQSNLTSFVPIVNATEMDLLSHGFTRQLFNSDGTPRHKVYQILLLAGMDSDYKNLDQINTWAQGNLLRTKERWDAQTKKFDHLALKPLFKELGLLDGVAPHFKEYDGAILHGALLPRVRLRLQYLVEQWKAGVRFQKLFFFGGERPLDPEQESRQKLLDDPKKRVNFVAPPELPKTEREMEEWVWEQSDIPEEMRKSVTVVFINAPMKVDPRTGEKTVRPSTADTVATWLKSNPQLGKYLAVSNAPYIFRQDLELRLLSPNDFKFDTVGSEASQNKQNAILLDELARLIFTLKQAKDKR